MGNKWQKEHPERVKEIQRAWYKANPEKSKARQQRYRARHPERLRERSRKHALRRYKITPEQYAFLWAAQEGKCAICGIVAETQKRRLDVDHCHKTNKVRGLLCSRCNSTLERLDKMEQWHERALAYLASPTTITYPFM